MIHKIPGFRKKGGLGGLLLMIGVLVMAPVSAKMVFQILPTVNISEEYSDNYLRTAANKQEEFITSYGLGISMSIQDVNKAVFLNYQPTYRDHKNLNDRDRLDHIVSLDATFKPTKHTELDAKIYYDGKNDDYQGDRRERKASISGATEVTQHSRLTYSHNYSRRFEEQLRTGTFKDHTVNTTRAGLRHQYGKKDILNVVFIYETDEYDVADADEYKKFDPSATASYWLSPKNGMEVNLAYQRKDFNLDLNDINTYSGHVRYIRNISPTLDAFLKYRHSYADTRTYTHQIYHPSAGIDWDITEDSGITLGVGALFHDWSNDNNDNVDPFIDLDAFKRFDFSPRTSLTITGSSAYASSGDTAASLGYNTSYQVGAAFNHMLAKRLSTRVFGTYSRIEFDQPQAVDRKDDRASLGAGLTWTPLKWLQLGVNYSFTDYRTTDATRDDYQDNRVFFSVTLVPEQPLRPDQDISREAFDDNLFTRENYWKP